MTTTVIIIALLAALSIGVNIEQYRRGRENRQDYMRTLRQCASMETRMAELETEKGKSDTHVKWAIATIKDLTATNKSLKEALRMVSRDKWKEWQNKHREEVDNG